jgi:hypothetical protein
MLQGNRGQEQEATGHQTTGTAGYRAPEARDKRLQREGERNRRLQGNRSQEQEATGHQTAGTGDHRAANSGEEDIGLWRAGTGGYRTAC